MACENQGDLMRHVREEIVGGDSRDWYRGKLKSTRVKSGGDLMENKIHDDSPKNHAEEETNSQKARSIYVGAIGLY
jgi:hypothetical protein